MKTSWFKGFAAAAVAAFTFGFAPSAQAIQTIHWSGSVSSWQTEEEVDNEECFVQGTKVALALVNSPSTELAKIEDFKVGSRLKDDSGAVLGKIIGLYEATGSEDPSFSGSDVVLEGDPQEGWLAILVLNHETGKTASLALDDRVRLEPKEGEFTADYYALWFGYSLTFDTGYTYPIVEAEVYDIIIKDTAHGTVETNPKGRAVDGDLVTITASPGEGYECDDMTVTKNDGSGSTVEVTKTETVGTFTMPACGVVVAVTFKEAASHFILCEELVGGEVTSDKSEATKGTTVKLTVKPASHYLYATDSLKVAGDSGEVTTMLIGENTYTFVMPDEDVVVKAKFEGEPYKISLVDSLGGSTIKVLDYRYSQSDTTEFALEQPTKKGYDFVGWSGNAQSPSAPLPTGLSIKGIFLAVAAGTLGDKTIYAHWIATRYGIDIEKPKHGTVTTKPAEESAAGVTVEIIAEPEEGYVRDTMTVTKTDEPGVTVKVTPTATGGTFTMPGFPVTVAVTFKAAAVPHDINLQQVTGGEVTSDKGSATKGEKVTLTVNPASHYLYVEDSLLVVGESGPVETTPAGENTFTFVMPDENVSVSAQFKGESYEIDLVDAQEGTLMDILNYQYSQEKTTEFFIENPSKQGYEFAGWSGSQQDPTASLPEGLSIEDTKLTVAAGTFGNKEIYAHWKEVLEPHSVTIMDPTGGAVTSDKGTATKGEKVTLTVEAYAPLYHYVEGSLTVAGVSGEVETTKTGENTFTFVMPNEEVVVSAQFEVNGIQVGDNVYAIVTGSTCMLLGTGATWDFKQCTNELTGVTTVSIGDGITHIGSRFFKKAYNLQSVTGGKDLTSVGENAFYLCTRLETITLSCTKAPEGMAGAVVSRTAIKPSGEPYVIPAVSPGYEQVLFGKAAISDEWKDLGSPEGKNIYDQGDNKFFKVDQVLEK